MFGILCTTRRERRLLFPELCGRALAAPAPHRGQPPPGVPTAGGRPPGARPSGGTRGQVPAACPLLTASHSAQTPPLRTQGGKSGRQPREEGADRRHGGGGIPPTQSLGHNTFDPVKHRKKTLKCFLRLPSVQAAHPEARHPGGHTAEHPTCPPAADRAPRRSQTGLTGESCELCRKPPRSCCTSENQCIFSFKAAIVSACSKEPVFPAKEPCSPLQEVPETRHVCFSGAPFTRLPANTKEGSPEAQPSSRHASRWKAAHAPTLEAQPLPQHPARRDGAPALAYLCPGARRQQEGRKGAGVGWGALVPAAAELEPAPGMLRLKPISQVGDRSCTPAQAAAFEPALGCQPRSQQSPKHQNLGRLGG